MPRNVSGIYTVPVGTDGVANTTIFSAKYNTYIHDVETDLNTPRPIVAGGTGASDAGTALKNMGGQIAGQVVTNYDTFAFQAGSFYSAIGATGAPDTVSSWVGECLISNNDPNYITLIATQVSATPPAPLVFTREKVSGTWGSWVASGGSDRVLRAGDTMTGNLVIKNSSRSYFGMDSPTGINRIIEGMNNGKPRWDVVVGNLDAETGSNAGTNFGISRFDDSGNFIGTPLFISRQAGSALFSNDVLSHGNFFSMLSPTTGSYHFGSSGTKYLNYDGGSFVFSGGPLYTPGLTVTSGNNAIFGGNATFQSNAYFIMGSAGGAGAFYDTAAGSQRFWCGTDPSRDLFRIYSVQAGDVFQCGSDGTVNMTGGTQSLISGSFKAGLSFACKSGSAGVYGNGFNIYHTGATQDLWIDSVRIGSFAYTSDYRIKKDVIDLPGMWDTVKALRPIKYTQAEFTPPSQIKYIAKQVVMARQEAEKNPDAEPREVSTGPMFPADDIERWGFIAHELQETLTPSAANGVKDSPDTVQSPNPFTLLAALTKALQEAMARIEALEAQ